MSNESGPLMGKRCGGPRGRLERRPLRVGRISGEPGGTRTRDPLLKRQQKLLPAGSAAVTVTITRARF